MAAAAKLVEHLSPLQRLLKQPVRTLDALLLLCAYQVPFVVIGAVAALLQGFPTPFQDMRVLVRDDHAALESPEQVLLAEVLIFEPRGPEKLRNVVERSWAIAGCDVVISLVPELPGTTSVLLNDQTIRLLPPAALLDDPEVAAILRIMSTG